ncbi:MAG TPA: hypothetical protein V6C65_26880 [Allocoleopsis sp.]
MLREKLAHDLSRLLSTPAFWFITSSAVAATLQIMPIASPQQWKGDVKQGWNFGATAVCLTIAVATSGKLERDVTEIRVRNRMGHQYVVDEMVDAVNLQRAATSAKIRLLNGCFTQGEIQQQMGQIMAMLKGGYIDQPALPPAGGIQPEDLAQSIADTNGDENNILFVGKSRSGKTSIMVNAMARKTARHSGDLDWFVFNGKPEKDNDWGGLAASPNDYWEVNSDEKAVEMMRQFKTCVKTLQTWQSNKSTHYPMFIAADEINNQRILLDDQTCKTFDKMIALFATQCMSEQSGLWLASHSHNVEDIGLNRKLQQSFQIVALGRNGKYESIAAVLDDQLVIRDKGTRDRLKHELQEYINAGGNGAIAFTNLGGDSRLVKLPHYSKDVRIQRNAMNQSTAEILAEDNEVSRLEQLFKKDAEHPIEQFYHSDVDESLVQFFGDDGESKQSPKIDSELPFKFIHYCHTKAVKYADSNGFFPIAVLRKNWAESRGFNSETFLEFLKKINDAGFGGFDSTGKSWKPKIALEDLP